MRSIGTMKLKSNVVTWIGILVVIAFAIEHFIFVLYRNPHVSKSSPKSNEIVVSKQSSSLISSNIRNHTKSELRKLPSFAEDYSEYLFGSLIEREANSYNLHITTFMLSHYQVDKNSPFTDAKKIHPFARTRWSQAVSQFQGLEYLPNGLRTLDTIYYCRIRISSTSKWYAVRGHFIPSKVSVDVNANRLLDILRCPMQQPRAAYQAFAKTNEEITVEIYRESTSIASFSIPWRDRRTGFLLTSPIAGNTTRDMWVGYTTPNAALDRVHVCVPGTRQYFSIQMIPRFLEFISHHLLLGAGHIYLPLALSKSSHRMTNALKILRSFIAEGKLTVVSTANDGIDLVQSSSGMSWPTTTIKVLHINMCLYQAKGVVDYVSIQDLDEFFIPKRPHNTFADVITAAESPTPLQPISWMNSKLAPLTWTGGRGWADGHTHPFCHLLISSIPLLPEVGDPPFNAAHPWLGEKFKHGIWKVPPVMQKALLPTRIIFQGGFAAPGACALPHKWTPCRNEEIDISKQSHSSISPFCGKGMSGSLSSDMHSLYEVVKNVDAKALDRDSDAVLYHFRFHVDKHPVKPNSTIYENEYTTRYYPAVRNYLQSRNLDVLVMVDSEHVTPAALGKTTDSWSSLLDPKYVNSAKSAQKSNCPSSEVPRLLNKRHLQKDQIVTLPNFATDYSEYANGAIIERVSDSFDLWLTTFFLGHYIVVPREGYSEATATMISPQVYEQWAWASVNMTRSLDQQYHQSGERMQPPAFQCKITHANGYESYTTGGRFVPGRLTTDSNVNYRLDIFRCKMKDTEQAYMKLADTSAIMTVEILKGGISILKYEIPWKTRMTGLMLKPVHGLHTIFDPWKGFNVKTPGVWKHEDVYMAVPGLELIPSQTNMALFLEFIEHHLQLGVKHIFLGALLAVDSPLFGRLLLLLHSYISEGTVSLVSTSFDGFDHVYSTDGIVWGRDNIKFLHVNMYTYLSKGVVDYVAVWDFDELFIPRGSNKSLMDVIRTVESPNKILSTYSTSLANSTEELKQKWMPGRGLADADGHPHCGIVLNSVVLRNGPTSDLEVVDVSQPWYVARYPHAPDLYRPGGFGFKKSIRSTRVVFMGTLHFVSACSLPPEWSPCAKGKGTLIDGFCWGDGDSYGKRDRIPDDPVAAAAAATAFGPIIGFHFDHRYDEYLSEADFKNVNHEKEGVLYHVQVHRQFVRLPDTSSKSLLGLSDSNEYLDFYFPSVYAGLDRRGLVLPITLPTDVRSSSAILESEQGKWLTSKRLASLSLPLSISPSNKLPSSYETALPAFSDDLSLLVLGALIERSSTSEQLFLTTLLFQPASDTTLSSLKYITGVRADLLTTWSQYMQTAMKAPLVSSQSFQCILKHDIGGVSYVTDGVLSLSEHADVPIAILRCPLSEVQKPPLTSNVGVSLRRSSQMNSLLSFSVPWKSRVNSALLQTFTNSSLHDPWVSHVVSDTPIVYSIVAGIKLQPTKLTAPLYLEHIQHSLNIGVTHVILSVEFGWQSAAMSRLLRLLRPFVTSVAVTVVSSAVDSSLDVASGWLGAVWDHKIASSIQRLSISLYLRGIATDALLIDVEDFFIPSVTGESIALIAKQLQRPDGSNSKGIMFKRDVVVSKAPQTRASWIGEYFNHGASLASALAYDSKGDRPNQPVLIYLPRLSVESITNNQLVYIQSNPKIISFYQTRYTTTLDELQGTNQYSEHYSRDVVNSLRKLHPLWQLIVDLPEQAVTQCTAEQGWTPYKAFYEMRFMYEKMGSMT